MESRAGNNIAVEDGGLAQLDTAGGVHVALKLAEHDQIANIQIGQHARVRPDGQAILGKRNGPLQIAVQKQVFAPGELSPDDNRFTDDGGTFIWLHALLFSLGCWSIRCFLPELYASPCREATGCAGYKPANFARLSPVSLMFSYLCWIQRNRSRAPCGETVLSDTKGRRVAASGQI